MSTDVLALAMRNWARMVEILKAIRSSDLEPIRILAHKGCRGLPASILEFPFAKPEAQESKALVNDRRPHARERDLERRAVAFETGQPSPQMSTTNLHVSLGILPAGFVSKYPRLEP